MRLGCFGGASEFAVLIGTQDTSRVTRQGEVRPDTNRSRLGRNDRVTDGATHVGTEDAARKIEVQHARRTEEAVVVVDLVVEPYPGLDGEGTFKDDTGLGDGGSRAVQGEHATEDAPQLSGDD